MKMNIKIAALPGVAGLALYFLTVFCVNAQNNTDVSLTIEQAIDYAMKNHPQIKNADLDIAIAHEKLSELIAIGLPQVNFSADLNKFIEIPTQFVPAEFFGGTPGSYAPVKFGQPFSSSAGVSASQLVFDGTYLIGVKASKIYQELSKKNAEQLKIEMAVNVTKTYYMTLVAQERVKQLNVDLERLEKVKKDTKALYEKGFAEKVDYDRIELNCNLLETAKTQAVRMIDDSYNLLKFQIGMDLGNKIILTEPIPAADKFSNLIETTAIDYSARIEYSILQTQQNLTELDLKRYQAQKWPSVVAFGSYSTNASRNEFSFFQSGYRWYPTAIVGASVKLPVFGGFQNQHRINQAKLNVSKVENAAITMQQGLALEYSAAVSKYNKSVEDLKLQQKNQTLAREILRISKVKFDRGVGSSLELVNAEASLREADTNYFSALLAATVAQVELDKATGKFKF